MVQDERCSRCGAELIRKSSTRLFVTGFAYLVLAVVLVFWMPGARVAMAIATIAGLTAAFLFVWALFGKARWCRYCKSFPFG